MGTVISWTNETWNPVAGCTRVSEGCRNCYAERISLKFGRSQHPWTKKHERQNVVLHPERLRKPFGWKNPSRVFVNSMSDLFHPLVPDEYIAQVFGVMADTPQHTYQILTKRPDRAREWTGPWQPNIWMGATVEDRKSLPRVDAIRACGAQTKFLSLEPLIERLDGIDLNGIDWVIVGGESGPGYRPMDMEWARHLRDIAVAEGCAYFFKQDSGYRTELRPWLVEEDGSRWEWHQYPGHVTPPRRLDDE